MIQPTGGIYRILEREQRRSNHLWLELVKANSTIEKLHKENEELKELLEKPKNS